MTYEDAIIAMEDGKKVCHPGLETWLIIEGGRLIDDKGSDFDYEDFDSLEEGWEIYSEPSPSIFN